MLRFTVCNQEANMTQPHKEEAKRTPKITRNAGRIGGLVPTNDDAAETAFLPAALELVETPASPLGRMLLYMICLLFTCVAVWSYFGKVDMVATAQGQIVPSGKVKIIQPLEIGVVSKIAVTDGQKVKAGDVLIEIDPTGSRAETARLHQAVMQGEVEIARLNAMSAAPDNTSKAVQAFLAQLPDGAAADTVSRQQDLLKSTLSQQAATLGGIDSDTAQKKAAHAQIEAEIAKLEDTLPLIQKRADMRRDLIAKGYSSVMEASQAQQTLIETRQALIEDRHKLEENDGALKQLAQQRAEAAAKFQATTLSQLADTTRKTDDARQQWIKAKDLAAHRVLTAPVDGTVQQLAIHTIGGVVTPAQQLMVVVPADAKLEVEAMIQNKDIGFVHEGQKVELKLETFPFTRYGLRHGTVLDISRDAVTPQQQQPEHGNAAGGAATTTPPASKDTLYKARISLDEPDMMVDGKKIMFTPGMTVTAEIKTGKQRVLQYLMDPLIRYKHDSFQER
jgi:hemolysin D